VPSSALLFMSKILLDNFLTILSKIPISTLSFSSLCFVCLPGNNANEIHHLSGCCVSFFNK
jgi:hypothetical protein